MNNNNFNFNSLVTSDFTNNLQERQSHLFLKMLNTVDPNSFITLYYFQTPIYLRTHKNGEICSIFNKKNLDPKAFLYLFHKNEFDIANLYAEQNSHENFKNNPIFIRANELNILKIPKYIQNMKNHVFLTFTAQELISIFSHSDKSLDEFTQIHLDKMTNTPVTYLLPNILSDIKCPWNDFDYNNKNISSFIKYLNPSDIFLDDKNTLTLFTQFHTPLYTIENDDFFAGFNPLGNIFDSTKSPFSEEKSPVNFFNFIKQNKNILIYQNNLFVDTIKKYPHETLEIFNDKNHNLPDDSQFHKFEHLKNLNINFMDFIPVNFLDENGLNTFITVHDQLNSFSKTKYGIFNSIDLRISHIQNIDNLGSNLLKNTFFKIYNHNPEYVLSMLKAMSFVHDSYFLREIIPTLFNDIENFSQNESFNEQLALVKIAYYPSIFEVFKSDPAIEMNLEKKSLLINLRSCLSHIEDNRYQHALNLFKFYFKTMKDTIPLLGEINVLTINTNDFVFNGNIHTTSHIGIEFEKCQIFNALDENQVSKIFTKISNDLFIFMSDKADKSSLEPLVISSELREQFLNLFVFLKDQANNEDKYLRVKPKI